MQALILAAGLGLRLGERTRDRTKAMVEVGGRMLISRALSALNLAGIEQALIVTGHGRDLLQQTLGDHHCGVGLSYLDNPDYATTNNIYSLWLARDYLAADDTFILESDIIFDSRLITEMLNNPHPNLAAVAKFEHWMDGTVTLLADDDSIVGLIPKETFVWQDASRYWKTVNIYKFSADFSRRLYLPFLDAYIRAFGNNRFYEQVLGVITYLSQSALKAHPVQELRWYEIDDPQDLDIASTLFSDAKQRLSLLENRYGGYWRFSGLLDFCYLVNPYFPGKRFKNELAAGFSERISSYPSGQKVLADLAGQMFGVDGEVIAVGNGAAELIRPLMQSLKGPIGMVVPSFDEYAASVPADTETRFFRPDPLTLSYTITQLAEFAQGLGALVVVNPDNPTGHFIAPHDILMLAETLRDQGTHLILDESFIDFAKPLGDGSLLKMDCLRNHPNLIIIRSLGKSHGIAGLRLGVVATSCYQVLADVRKKLAIWNINALAESFLQIIRKHQNDYRGSCLRLNEEKGDLWEALACISDMHPLPSSANFVLCRITGQRTAREMAQGLLEQHDILVKDCSGKHGLEHGQYLRIAQRNAEDNQKLISALRAL